MRSSVRWRALVLGHVLILARGASGDEVVKSRNDVHPLQVGPHLFVDDFLIERSDGVVRRVMPPPRSLKDPVLTGAGGHLNWQPWLTVLHDPTRAEASRFRVWFDADVLPDPAERKFAPRLGYLESADGRHWPGSPKILTRTDGLLFGASVLDDGPNYPRADERYKLMYYSRSRGPVVGFSPDGVQWTLHNSGREVLPNSGDSWHAGYDPLRKRYFSFGKSNQEHKWTNAEGKALSRRLRLFGTSTSTDFKTWTPLKMQFAPDAQDPGVTEGYAVTGFQTRGDLLLGFFQVLRDDLTAEGAPYPAVAANPSRAAGMGHTVLCWTRDGETWRRDRQRDAFLSPDPTVGAWDHAIVWVSSVVPVNDELFVYYAGYRWGHKYRRSEDRQVGLVKLRRDRYVAREAGEKAGTLTTRPLRIEVDALALNVNAQGGEARVQICDEMGQPLPGFNFADCRPITEDSLNAAVAWKHAVSDLRGKTVRLQFLLRKSRLYAIEASKPNRLDASVHPIDGIGAASGKNWVAPFLPSDISSYLSYLF